MRSSPRSRMPPFGPGSPAATTLLAPASPTRAITSYPSGSRAEKTSVSPPNATRPKEAMVPNPWTWSPSSTTGRAPPGARR